MKKSASLSLDPEQSLKAAAEITEACLQLRDAYLVTNLKELRERFSSYLDPLAKFQPEPDAIILGFREAWLRRDYLTIKNVGDRLRPEFFLHQREAQGYHLAARRLLGRGGSCEPEAESGDG